MWILTLFILSTTVVTKVYCDGDVTVKFISYENSDGTLRNGHCCDSWPLCTNACDFRFKICLSNPDSASRQLNSNVCNYAFRETRVVRNNRNSLNFGGNMGGVDNPIEFRIAGANARAFKLQVEVLDQDRLSHCDDVDFFTTELRAEKDAKLTFEISSRTSLTVSTKLECSDDWYGDSCGVYCPESPHDSYTCNPVTGSKDCNTGWRGEQCDDRYKIHQDE